MTNESGLHPTASDFVATPPPRAASTPRPSSEEPKKNADGAEETDEPANRSRCPSST